MGKEETDKDKYETRKPRDKTRQDKTWVKTKTVPVVLVLVLEHELPEKRSRVGLKTREDINKEINKNKDKDKEQTTKITAKDQKTKRPKDQKT